MVLLRIVQATSVVVGLSVVPAAQFAADSAREALLRALLIGGVLVMIAFNLAVSVATRDTAFLLNALTISSILLLDLYLTGVGAAFVWGETGWISNRVLDLGLLLPTLFGCLLFYVFLADRPAARNRLVKSLLVPPALAAGVLVAMPFVPYWRIQQIALALGAAMLVLLLAVCATEARRGNRRAMALIVPLLGSIVPGALLTAGSRIEGIAFSALDGHILELTLICEALLFSLALAYRIRISQQERDAAQQQLVERMASGERELIAAVDAERSRIAADIHDTAGQGLVTVVNRLQRVARNGELPHALSREIGDIASDAKETVGDIRRISH